jgi:peptidoglycan/LPS O-acetylase OafA/YrhL
MLKKYFRPARKAFVAGFIGFVGALGTGALADGALDQSELIAALVVAVGAAFATFQVKNTPVEGDEA